MKLKIRIEDLLYETDKACLFLIAGRQVWLPKGVFSYGEGKTIICASFFAKEKGLKGKPLFNKPKTIEPIYNQEALDELRFDPGSGS